MKRFAAILAVVLVGAFAPAGARADFGINAFDVAFTGSDGSPSLDAGSHPFATTVSLGLNSNGDEAEGRLRDLFLDLVPGLVANATHPRCTAAGFAMDDCSPATVVGTATSAFDESGQSATAPIFNVVPPPGTLLRLGFRLAGSVNVFLDLGLADRPPYNLVAEVSEIPEAIELFGVELELWGVPSDEAHDVERGGPVASQSAPFLTLPTSCEGPVSSFYEAVSWDEDEDLGESVTHDGAGSPMGFMNCGRLTYMPQLLVKPTTAEAQSASGLDLSLAFHDDGLLSSTGRAESQVRELALTLPEGMAAGPALSGGAGACAQADFEEEGVLEDTPDEGCPDTSKAGMVEVESPLIEGSVEGVVYRAVPFANLAEDAPMALYLVFRDAEFGIVVKQPVGLEVDTESDQLIAFAEEVPQLPFSDLQLHLEEEGGLLVSPPRCDEYEVVAEHVPWADDDQVFVTTSSFEISSGPDDGACPDDGGDLGPGSEGKDQDPPTSTGTPPPSAAPLNGPSGSGKRYKRPCPRGKRRARRNGKVRCVKRASKKSKRRSGHSAGRDR